MFRVLVPGLVLTFLCCSSASADTFDEYQLAESVTLPGGGGVFDFLNDGRMIVLAVDEVYIETAIRSREFEFLGTLADAEIPSFGAAFLRVSPDGQRVAVGNNGFGPGAAVGLFELIAKGGVHPKLAQKLARHSDINLTMSPASQHLRATDTTDAAAHDDSAASCAQQCPRPLERDSVRGRANPDKKADGGNRTHNLSFTKAVLYH